MKKYLMSLAALMITLSATVLTSCNPKNEPENVVTPGEITPEPGTHVETLTIAFPEQTQTRVAIDGSYNLTGWELGDEVVLVKTEYIWGDMMMGTDDEFNLVGTYAFTCTNADNGTFTGTLPDGTSVNDCQLAFYNAEGFTTYNNFFQFKPKYRASQNMKDVVMLVAKNDGEGNFDMEIFGSILQVTNNTSADITASVKYRWYGYGYHYDCAYIDNNSGEYSDDCVFKTYTSESVEHSFTLSCTAPTYVYIPVYNTTTGNSNFAVGLSAAGDAANECSIVPFKTNPGNAKLFKTLTAPTTGTAKATIEGNEVDVNWVQLWAGGPKFAEYNVGASSSTDTGTMMTFTEATSNVWGANWCIPSKDDMDELVNAANPLFNGGSTKVTCEYVVVSGVDGFRFTGVEEGYTENSVFFPGQKDDTYDVNASYWSGTAYDSRESWYMYLNYYYSELGGEWRHTLKARPCRVRPVLNN